MKFFTLIRTGTLQRERTRIAAKRGHHLRRVMQLDVQIAALQNERNEHFDERDLRAGAHAVTVLREAR